jgi:hypothetical protein
MSERDNNTEHEIRFNKRKYKSKIPTNKTMALTRFEQVFVRRPSSKFEFKKCACAHQVLVADRKLKAVGYCQPE